MRTALTIAGSDSGGGAGIQADLKTFHAHGVFGTSVITALTAQNTHGVSGIHPVPGEFVAEQYRQVLEDIGADAAKTGMLANAEVIGSVAEVLQELPVPFLVVDPVMISKSGARLLEEDAVQALIDRILPLATVATPNLHEAAALAGTDPIEDRDGQMEAARRIAGMGPAWVLVKGGHLPAEDDAVDLLYDGEEVFEYRAPRLDQRHTHGTGCTYSAAIAAGLARGIEIRTAVARAKAYITEAIRTAPGLGGGVGPLNHFADVPEGGDHPG